MHCLFDTIKKLVLITCAGLCAVPLSAVADEDAHQLFAKGIAAFREGDFQSARDAFLAAKSAGLDGATLHYNLGVTDYKLGYYPSAYESFKKAAADPRMGGLATYNLGLVSLKLLKKDLALKWFLSAQALASDPQLQRLNNYMLVKLRNDPERQPRVTDVRRPPANTDETAALNGDHAHSTVALRGVIKSDLGFDDNVVLYRDSASSSATDVSDLFVALQAVIQATVSPRVNVNVSGYRLDYAKKNAYDFAKFGLESSYDTAFAAWRTRFSGGFEQYSLAGNAYQQVTLVKVRGRYALTRRQSLRLNYRADFINELDEAYAHLAGRRDSLATAWHWGDKRSFLDISYSYETNNRNEFYYDGVLYASYSPVRHTIDFLVSKALSDRFAIEIFSDSIYSFYKRPDMIGPGHPVLRRDEMFKAGAKLTATLRRRLRIEGDYFYARNRSIFTKNWYENNRYILGVRWDY